MHKFFIGLIFTTASLIFSLSNYAWNATGHTIIAKIAYNNLRPAVREKVDKMVMSFSKEYPDIKTFPQIAPWPDQLRSQKIEIYTHWHYVNYSFSTDGTQLKNLIDTDNVVWAIGQIEPIVQNTHANPIERARFLAFLVHIIGDIHQPLHVVSRISAAHPDGDQGGNLYPIKNHINHQMTNLHSSWDNGLGLFSSNEIEPLIAKIIKEYPERYFGDQVNDLNQMNWAQEGIKTATTFVYNTPEGQIPNSIYVAEGQEIAKQKVALAGYRLAALLNKLL